MNQQQMLNLPQMLNPMVSQAQMMPPIYGNWAQQPLSLPPMNPTYGRSNWKTNNRIQPGSGAVNELENQNRLKARRFNHKKKFNRTSPYAYAHAPKNTTSYLIRAKKEGGIASLVSPSPVTPAELATPVFSPSKEAWVDMAKEQWGVDGYGTMKGLIRLRSSPFEDEDEGDSSESDVEEHLEVERRLDQDLSRFEIIYPVTVSEYSSCLENRVDDQDSHLSQLEGENLWLKEKLHSMERELGEMKRRMQFLERQSQVVEEIHDEVDDIDNVSGTLELDAIAGQVLEDENNDLMCGCGEVDDGKDLIEMEETAPNKEQ